MTLTAFRFGVSVINLKNKVKSKIPFALGLEFPNKKKKKTHKTVYLISFH